MRSEKEMLDLILGFAQLDERVRIVGMEGSRTNQNVPRDKFQDYDISFLVTEIDSFRHDHSWVDIFGERIIKQMPEAMSLFAPSLGNWFSYLMLFDDSNRIDLTLIPLSEAELYLQSDKLLQILLDKDNLLPLLPASTDIDYHVKKPSREYFDDCCNEFWWVSTYVAKGLWRKEILFAIDHLNQNVRSELLRMMEWKVGIETNFSLSVGKNYKYLEQYVDAQVWQRLLKTYDMSSCKSCWDALFQTLELFRETAQVVAKQLKYHYPQDDDERVTKYLKDVYSDSV